MKTIFLFVSFIYFYNLFLFIDPKITLISLSLKQLFLITLQSFYLSIILKDKTFEKSESLFETIFKTTFLLFILSPSIFITYYFPFVQLFSILIIRELNEEHFLFSSLSFLISLIINILALILFKSNIV